MNNIDEILNKDKIFNDFGKSFEKQMKENPHVNVLITGKTGVGKSTLINEMFGYKVAKDGVGQPVTQKTELFENDETAIRIYDTKGLELDGYEETVNEIESLIKEKNENTKEDDMVGVIWYAIAANGGRIEPAEIKFINELRSSRINVPVVIVLTKSDNGAEIIPLRKEIEEYVQADEIVNVLSKDTNIYDLNGDKINTIKSYGLPELANVTYDLLPDLQKLAFANEQKVNQELKLKQAKKNKDNAVKAIQIFVASTFAEGFIPIPFADSAMMIPTQMTMIAKINAIYNVDITKSMVGNLVTGLVAGEAGAFAGRTIAGNLAKFVPGAGSIVGGIISGGTGAMITAAIGLSYIQLIEMSQQKNWSGDEFANFLSDVDFKQVLGSVNPDMVKSLVNFVKKSK